MKTLKQTLAENTEEQLKQLAAWWGIGDSPEEGWKHHYGLFIQRMQDPIAIRFAWEQINEDERKVLHNLINFSASNGVLHDVLHKITRLPESNFDQALTTLKNHMLILEEPTTIKYAGATSGSSSKKQAKPTATKTTRLSIAKELFALLLAISNEINAHNLDRSYMKLENILSRFGQERLYEIARLYGFMLHDYYSRTAPSARLVGQMVQPDVVYYAWEHLDTKTRRLLKWLCENDGVATMQDAREHTGFDNSELSSAIHTLEQFALAFDVFSGTERKLFVPVELLKNLKKAALQSEDVEDAAPGLLLLEAPPPSIQKGDTLILYDMATILGAMFQQNIEPTQSNRVPKRITNKLQTLLQIKPRPQAYEDGEDTLDMLFSVAQELGLVKLSRSTADSIKPKFVQGPQFENWSRKDIVDQTHSLLEYWLAGHPWIDVAGVNVSQTSSYYDSYYLDILAGRKAVIAVLNTLTPGQWYSMNSLLRTIKDQNPYVLRPRYAAMGVSGFRSNRNMMANWYNLDGQIILGMLSSSLHELGLITLGYQQSHISEDADPVNPDAFMLTDLASAVLETKGETSYTAIPSNGRSLIVQPSFELLLLQPDLSTVYSLLPFAQVNQIGMASRLTLTRQSVMRGLEAGRNIEQIIKILEEHSQKELPQNVVYTLRDWTKSYKEVSISQVLLLDVPNEAIANDICTSAKFSAFGPRKIGPCVIAVDSDTTLTNLRRALEKEGIVVRINGDIISKPPPVPTYHSRY